MRIRTSGRLNDLISTQTQLCMCEYVCVCVHVRGLMIALSAEIGTQEGISRHCISKALPLETQGRVFLMRGGTGMCVCVLGSVFGWVTVYAFLHTPSKAAFFMIILLGIK